MAWDEKDKKKCCEIVKDCLAMANTPTDHDYGYLVIGVSESPSGFCVTGLSEQQAESWDTTRFNNFLKNYTDDPINTTMRKTRINDKIVIVVYVPRFVQNPYMCTKAYPGVLSESAIYMRTDSNESAPAKAADMRKLFEFVRQQNSTSKSIEDRYEGQIGDARLSLRNLLANSQVNYDSVPLMVSMIYPSEFREHRLPIEDLKPIARKAYVGFYGWEFPVLEDPPYFTTTILNDCIETYHFRRGMSPSTFLMDYWRLYTSGLLFHSWYLSTESIKTRSHTATKFVSMTWLVKTPGLAAKCLVNLLTQYVSVDDSVNLAVEVVNSGETGLSQDMLYLPVGGDYFCSEPVISDRKVDSLGNWCDGYIDKAIDMARSILWRYQFGHLSRQRIRSDFVDMFGG